MRRPAFTLLEVTLVLALVVILAAIAIPSLTAMHAQFKVSAAADAIKAALTAARAHAIEEGQPYQVAVVPGTGNFRVAPQSTAYWGGGDLPAVEGEAVQPYVFADHLPAGTIFSDGGQVPTDDNTVLAAADVGPGQWRPVAVFLPDGTARIPEDADQEAVVELVVRAQTSAPIVVTLRCLTGTVSTRRGS